MKQFSLEEYLKNPQRKIVTRRGKEVRIICTDRNITYDNVSYPIVALVKCPEEDNIEQAIYYTKEGKTDSYGSSADLFFAPEKKEGWINIYKYNLSSLITPGLQVYNTKEEAEAVVGDRSDYISTVKIQWEE